MQTPANWPTYPAMLAAAAAIVGSLAPAAWALPPEVWVVNEGSQSISIIDDLADVPGTIETISLGGLAEPPHGIAFSSLSTAPGEFAFVTQGRHIRVLEQASRVILATCDVAAWLGADEVRLRGVDAARPELFANAPDPPVERSLLHVAADVRLGPADPLEPWFVVLDQAVLAVPGPGCPNAVLGAGRLAPAMAAPREAMEVRVLGAPAGPARQRAWYTYRELSSPERLVAVLVAGGPTDAAPWRVEGEFAIEAPLGGSVPLNVHPGSPHSRELPLLPDPFAGELVDLQTGRRCPLDPGARALAVTGPGLGSYEIWTAKQPPGGGPGELQRSRWLNCAADPPLPVGVDPVDVETLGRVEWQEVYVANRGSDTISVVLASDPGQVVTIDLSPDPAPPCVLCPRSLAVLERPETICRAVDYRLELINNDEDILHSWGGIGCLDLPTFKLWCRCADPGPRTCPSWCPSSGPILAGEPWVEVNIVSGNGSGGGQTVTKNDGDAKVETNVEPNDEQAP